MPKFGESLTKISLRDLLNEQELLDIKKYKQFKTGAEKGFSYEKDELILKLVALVIDKFIEMKENTLVKCFIWAQKILQENLEIKLDSSTFKNLEKMKESKPGLKMKLGWMEEYSLLNKEEEIYKCLILGLKDYCSKNGFKKVALGVSGGIDSALVATIATEALGSDNVLGILMPSKISKKGGL